MHVQTPFLNYSAVENLQKVCSYTFWSSRDVFFSSLKHEKNFLLLDTCVTKHAIKMAFLSEDHCGLYQEAEPWVNKQMT